MISQNQTGHQKSPFFTFPSIITVIIAYDLSHDDIDDNDRLHIDSAYWQLFPISLNEAKPGDSWGEESISISCLFLNFISDVRFGYLKLITLLYLKLFIILILEISRAEEEHSYPGTT